MQGLPNAKQKHKKGRETIIEKDKKEYLKKLCFGEINDVVKLALFHDSLTEKQLKRLDLSQIAEIKRGKDNAFEIKLIDKLKAIECLCALEGAETDTASDFLAALAGGDSPER